MLFISSSGFMSLHICILQDSDCLRLKKSCANLECGKSNMILQKHFVSIDSHKYRRKWSEFVKLWFLSHHK